MPELGGEIFTPAEVSDLISQPEERILRWIKHHTLPAFMDPGQEWRIRRVDLIPWARPLLSGRALDALAPLDFESGAADIDSPSIFAELASAHFGAQEFERVARGQPLFHYTSTETALDAILLNGSLRLNPPTGMNDPFESGSLWPNFELGDAPTETDSERALIDLATEFTSLFRGKCRLACFTRSGAWEWGEPLGFGDGFTRARMWSQYGDAHAGVCLAFDQERLSARFQSQFASYEGVQAFQGPVGYRAGNELSRAIQLPFVELRADPETFLDDLFPSLVSDRYLTKSWDWSTETEYRCLVYGHLDEYAYLDITDSLTGIFLGPRFPSQRVQDLKVRCPAVWEAGRVYQVEWRDALPFVRPVGDSHIGNGPTWKLPAAPSGADPPS